MTAADLPTTDADLVRRLLTAQFPQWADLSITRLREAGTDHTLYRLGTDLVARMPRIPDAVDQAESDGRWLPHLAPHLPLPVPAPLAVGAPGEGFPWPWSVAPWIPGENPSAGHLDMDVAAVQLGEFVAALRTIGTTGGYVKIGTARGVPLSARDEITRTAIAELGDRVDGRRALAVWDRAVSARPWPGPLSWVHGDLQPGNLLVRTGRLVAVIDFGGLGLGDPAVDLMPAWNLFDGTSRRLFREASGSDDYTWYRGQGWSLSTAICGLPYYWDRDRRIVASGLREVASVLAGA
ncbi:MAG TPA: aminoglycoside phosphotransferase family protein [Micromonosporaceae bacterium]